MDDRRHSSVEAAKKRERSAKNGENWSVLPGAKYREIIMKFHRIGGKIDECNQKSKNVVNCSSKIRNSEKNVDKSNYLPYAVRARYAQMAFSEYVCIRISIAGSLVLTCDSLAL